MGIHFILYLYLQFLRGERFFTTDPVEKTRTLIIEQNYLNIISIDLWYKNSQKYFSTGVTLPLIINQPITIFPHQMGILFETIQSSSW